MVHDYGGVKGPPRWNNLDRLTGITYFDTLVDAFAMDDLGNRTGSETQCYTAIDAAPIAHDPAGNLTRDRQNYRYEYDYENRIARIYTLSGETQDTLASFDYDALGHRVRKIDAVAGQTTLYYNDPEWRVLAEYDNGSTTPQRTFVYGNYIDEALRMQAGESDYYTLHDHLYSPAVLIGYGYESGQWRPVERYPDKIGNAYGTARVINRGPDNAWFTADDVITGSSAINTTLFTGRTLDALDSANLKISYYRHRYTDPFTGRFLQQDPLGYMDSLNLFEYVRSNPLRLSDPFGTNLYAIDGTWTNLGDGSNTETFFNYSHDIKYYWNGPSWGATGADASAIYRGVRDQICQDYCAAIKKGNDIKINLIGWSRGATIALEVAQELNQKGCCCCRAWYGSCQDRRYPPINWMGLFDAVDMTITTGWAHTVSPNIQHFSHAKKTQFQLMYPTIQTVGRRFFRYDGTVTTHNDIGMHRDNNGAFEWIVEEAIAAGVE